MKNSNDDMLITRDFFVPHISTVRANAGQLVGIHVRQKISASTARAKNGPGKGRVVLFVHGGNVPVVPAFDLDYRDYSWMAYLALAGFNVYGLDLSGYGSSPRPMMDDPANVDSESQGVLVPRQLKAPCPPNYPWHSHTIHSDWAEMDSVIDQLRIISKARKVHLIGWSAGGPRAGGYAALHPDKVDRMVLFAPSAPDPGLKNIPEQPGRGAPTKIQTRKELEQDRWDPNVGRRGQVAPGVRDVIWKQIMQWDAIGASWGPPGGVMRSPNRTRSGWTPEMAASVKAPVLIVTGELDKPEVRLKAYDQLGSKNKAYVRVDSASHFMIWEKQRHVLHAVSMEWLAENRVNGVPRGRFSVDWNGRFKPVPAATIRPGN